MSRRSHSRLNLAPVSANPRVTVEKMARRIDHYTRSVDEAPAAAARAPKCTPFHARSAAASRRRPRAVRIPSHRRAGRAAHASSESLSDAAAASVCCTRRFAAPTRWHDQHARRRASEHSVRDPLFPAAPRAILRMTQARVCGPSQRKAERARRSARHGVLSSVSSTRAVSPPRSSACRARVSRSWTHLRPTSFPMLRLSRVGSSGQNASECARGVRGSSPFCALFRHVRRIARSSVRGRWRPVAGIRRRFVRPAGLAQ